MSSAWPSVDFFTIPTIRFQVLYVFLVLAHNRRRILHFGVTGHPTAEWTEQQIREAFPWDTTSRYLLRGRDRTFGQSFVDQVKAMGIEEVLSAPRSPWQRAHVERVIVFNQRDLSRHLQAFRNYYHRTNASWIGERHSGSASYPIARSRSGRSIPEAGARHHRYERRVA